MVSLSIFIGQLLSDLANARTNADYSAVCQSEQYHTDPFVKNLPIPHYIIDEAEIDFPVMVIGVTKQSEQFAKQKLLFLECISTKLPILLMRNYKYDFYREREKANKQEEEKRQIENKMQQEKTGTEKPNKPAEKVNFSRIKINDSLLEKFSKSVKNITEKMYAFMQDYLDNYNYEVIKLLDLTEDFIKQLIREKKIDTRFYLNDGIPYSDDETITKASKYIGNIMFHFFKKVMQSDPGVNIDIQTVQMNEYATQNCLMHIKLKIKEQDLNLLVEQTIDGKEKRYLSLS